MIIKFPDFPDIESEYLRSIDPCNSSDTNEMHVISHCNTHIYCHNYDNRSSVDSNGIIHYSYLVAPKQ